MTWNWRPLAHKLTGRHFHRHWSLSKGEVRVEMWSGPDGETLEHIELYAFGKLKAESHGTHEENMIKVRDWIENEKP